MRRPSEGWFRRGGIDLHYLELQAERSGDVKPPIVLLHGLSSNAHYWERVAEHLPNRRLVAIDQRGHGLTGSAAHRPSVPDGFAMTELIRDVTALSDALELNHPVVVGHLWGATVALRVVASQPSFASALVFIDGPIANMDRFLAWDEALQLMQPPLRRYHSIDEAIEDAKLDFGEAWKDDLRPFVEARVMPDGPELILTLTAPIRLELLRGMYESKVEELWSLVRVPAVAMVARLGPARISRSREEGIERAIALTPRLVVKRMSSPHDIPLYLPAEVAFEIDGVTSSVPDLPAISQP